MCVTISGTAESIDERIERLNRESEAYEAAQGYERPYTVEYTDYRDCRKAHVCQPATLLRKALMLALDDVRGPVVTDATGRVVADSVDAIERVSDAMRKAAS